MEDRIGQHEAGLGQMHWDDGRICGSNKGANSTIEWWEVRRQRLRGRERDGGTLGQDREPEEPEEPLEPLQLLCGKPTPGEVPGAQTKPKQRIMIGISIWVSNNAVQLGAYRGFVLVWGPKSTRHRGRQATV